MQSPITRGIARVIGEALGEHYFSHRVVEARCAESGIRTEPMEGLNCSDKITAMIAREAQLRPGEIASIVGRLLEEYMDGEGGRNPDGRAKVAKILQDNGLTYSRGGSIHGAGTSVPTRSLDELLRQRSIPEIEKEFERALASVEKDPPAAITAACAILESFCRVYLQQAGITPPGSETARNLWKLVATHIGFAPSPDTDEGMKRIFSGFFAVVDGVSLLRNHDSSAHGREARDYVVLPRHARLAVHAAHTLVLFGLESWNAVPPAPILPSFTAPPSPPQTYPGFPPSFGR
jgi:Abortive infection C-terminus